MEDKINEILDAHGLEKSDLTNDELEALKAEIENREKGIAILDGVLSNPEIYYRRLRKNGNSGSEAEPAQ